MSAYHDTNIVTFPLPGRPSGRTSSDPLALLAGLAARVAEIGLIPLESRQNMLSALVLLDQSNAQARQLIGEIDDLESRSRLLAHSERIGELIKMARRKAEAI